MHPLATWCFQRLIPGFLLLFAMGVHGFDFVQGHYYGTDDSRVITEYDRQGQIVSTLTLSSLGASSYLRGSAFGPDNLLYVVVNDQQTFSLRVLALSNHGAVQAEYRYQTYIGGNLVLGRIDFDNDGNFYVSTGIGVIRFQRGSPASGALHIGAGSYYDMTIGPDNRMFLVSDYNLYEYTIQGTLTREIPYNFTNNRAVEYDPVSNSVFVSTLGHTGSFFQLLKFSGATGTFLDQTTFVYGTDFFLNDQRQLVVGSWTQNPAVFSLDLDLLSSFEGQNLFVTQMIPEPSTWSLLIFGLVGCGVSCFRNRIRCAGSHFGCHRP